MNIEKRIQVTSDPGKNLLKISFTGKVTTKEMPYLKEQISRELVRLNKGFSLQTDLTDLFFMETQCAPFIKKIMELLSEHGIEQVVRIIPDPSKDIGLSIMSRFHYRHGIKIITVKSHREADLESMKTEPEMSNS